MLLVQFCRWSRGQVFILQSMEAEPDFQHFQMCTFQHILFDPGNALCLRISNFNCSDFFFYYKRGGLLQILFKLLYLNTEEHLHSQQNIRFSVCAQVCVFCCCCFFFLSVANFPCSCSTVHVQHQEEQSTRFRYIGWLY